MFRPTGTSPGSKHAGCQQHGPESDDFLHWLLERAGLDAREYRAQPLQRRLAACLRTLRASSPQAARVILEQHPDRIPQALSAILIGVTDFFRDAPVFDAIRSRVLPELTDGRRGLRVWSAGCSDGCELYSVAILLAEMGLLEDSHLLGTDCRADTVANARRGVYGPGAVAGLDPGLVDRYFQRTDGSLRVLPLHRRHIDWAVRDLLSGELETGWDLVLCRNVVIYLDSTAAERLWRRLVDALRPGGYLIAGKAERPARHPALMRMGPCVYRKERDQ